MNDSGKTNACAFLFDGDSEAIGRHAPAMVATRSALREAVPPMRRCGVARSGATAWAG